MNRQWSKFQGWNGNEKQWIENTEYVEEDLCYLLGLKAPDFWNRVNDTHCNELLDSCLINLPRSHEEASKYSAAQEPLLERIYRRVFLVFLRLSTHNEKPFSSPKEFGQVIYNNFFISLPQIFDLVNLFGQRNRSLLRNMLENIFKHQPNYLTHDLPIAIDVIMAQMMERELEDAQLVDTFKTVHNFLSLTPSRGTQSFYEKGFLGKAAEFYSHSLSKMSSRNGKLARHFLLNSARLIIQNQLLAPENLRVDTFQEYQDLLLHLISEENFILDYDAQHPISKDIDLFISNNPHLDRQAVDYILQGVSKVRDSLSQRVIHKSAQEHQRAPIVTANKSVSMVKETIPELGEGFILKCLDYYEGDPEKVINALFEDNLPPHLSESDRSEETSRISEQNGPKKVPKKVNAVLDDKSFMASENVKSFYQIRGLVSDVVVVGEGDEDYDDEYDDTYDDQCTGLEEPDAHDERRAFVLPRALGGGHIGKTVTEREDSEDSEDEGRVKSLEFCRNPQEVREERERKRLANQRGGGRSGGSGFGNVVGNKKGQGQDKSVLLSRARKNANKNKGHRIGADRKMAKGMF